MGLDVCFTIITDCTSLVVQSVVTKSVQGSKNMVQTQNTLIRICTLFSGVATLGHAGAHAVALLIVNRALNGLEIERLSIAMYNTELRVSYAHHTRDFAASNLHFAAV